MFGLLLAAVIGAQQGPVDDLVVLRDYINRNPDVNWSDYRVLSFTTLLPQHREEARNATAYAIETLNRRVRKAPVYPINENLWAIDTRTLKWERAAWDDMSKEWAYYKEMPARLQSYFVSTMGTRFPIMRADVFVRDSWEPEWYQRFLRLPDNRGELLRELSAGDKEWLRSWHRRAYAAVVDDSAPSKHPRKIVATTTPLGYRMYVSMNYLNRRGKHDSIKFPTHFMCHYNEIFFESPNGLDIYYSNNGGLKDGSMQGKDWSIVHTIPIKAAENFVNERDNQIVLGRSCIECHVAGAREFTPAPVASLDFSTEKRYSYSVLYNRWFNSEKITERVKEDSTRVVQAIKRINGLTPTENATAFKRVRDRFDSDVQARTAAHELGVKPSELKAKLVAAPNLSPTLRRFLQTGVLTREEWENEWTAVVRLFKDERRVASR